jgi:hypothetical protein
MVARSHGPSGATTIVSFVIMLLWLAGWGASPVLAQQSCDPLPPPTGNVIDVYPGDVGNLAALVASAASGDTILLHDGTYDLRQTLQFSTPGVSLRSASGSRDAVIIDGGYTAGSGYDTGFLIQIWASDVTIADLTLRYAYYHPIQIYGPGTPITGILIHNLRIIDPGQQAIKINPSGVGFVDYGTIECCAIELTDFGRTQIRDGCYTGGIDVHQAWGWVVRRNYITGFWCDSGLSEHGIHFWKGCRDTVAEENLVVDCARGIGYGLGSSGTARTYPDNPYPGVVFMGHIDGIIRNNFVAATDPNLFASDYGFDTGVGLEQSHGTEVLHNTVASTNDPASSSIEWRFPNTLVHAANNLVSHVLLTRDGAVATIEGNIESAPLSWFENVPAGDLHLTALATTPVDGGVLLGGLCDTDIDGDLRDAQPDVGADELVTTIFADGFESGDTSEWSIAVQ